ncbi:hypothetical protein [Noviherbaspirillum pedocola]|uniref:Uncharacterized protein n=1 Tax=Noviherbaspirillum pedocola TaxID=2801341 RepID=A0A934SZF4_9BURK|nr:hypothetical protein [Noviherbaspirillum pedocola]MBK4737841.1 hypothetical protein [Noviherbaspirillum pedocola]
MSHQAADSTVQAGASNIALWETVQATDPRYTRDFTRADGFSGTAINATYQAKKATEAFGPMGLGWGVKILEERYVEGAHMGWNAQGSDLGREKIHVVRIELWYKWNNERGAIEHFGQTKFIGCTARGVFTDEEAPKKSVTEATSKCLSLLGFGADVYMGLYDDSKYVSAVRDLFAENDPVAGRSQPVAGSTAAVAAGAATVADAAGSANATGPALATPAAPQLSERYKYYKEEIPKGVADVERKRFFIQNDRELSDMERATLLSMPELQAKASAPASDNSPASDSLMGTFL